MITDERTCNNNLCVGEEVVCALIINGNLVKHEGYNIPTVAIKICEIILNLNEMPEEFFNLIFL